MFIRVMRCFTFLLVISGSCRSAPSPPTSQQKTFGSPSSASKYAPPADKSSAQANLATGGSASGNNVDGLTWIYTSPEKWYTQHDLCIIKNWQVSTNVSLVELAKTKCHLDVLKDEWAGRLYVGYGNSYKAACSPPLTDRPQYMQALVGFNEPEAFHLVETMRNLNLLNRTLVFFGDSVMRQNYKALLAELKRLDKHIEIDRWASVRKMANKTVLPRVVNVFQRPEDDLEGGGATIWLARSHSSPLSAKDRPMAVYYVSCHRLEQGQFTKGMQLLQSIASKAKGVVLLANLGVHYNDRSEAFKAMNTILPELSSFASKPGKHNVVLWRETSAQHFEFRSQGYFDRSAANGRKEKHCTPHGMIKPVDRNDEIDWRNEDVKTILGVNQITNMHYIPFYAATRPLHAMHPDKEKAPPKYDLGFSNGAPTDQLSKADSPEFSAFAPSVLADCTHFCHLPTLWQPVWRALADVVKTELHAALGGLGAKEAEAPVGGSSGGPSQQQQQQQHTKSHSNYQGGSGHNSTRTKEKREKEIQYIRLNGSSKAIPIGPNFVLHVIHSAGAVVRNGIDIDKAAIIMKLPTNSNISSIRSVAIDDEGFQIIRYEVRNKQGQVEGWISSHVRDKFHNPIVEILQFCIQCIDHGNDNGRLRRRRRLDSSGGQEDRVV